MLRCNKPCESLYDLQCTITKDDSCCITCISRKEKECNKIKCTCPLYEEGMTECEYAIED